METFGVKIRALREEKDLSLRELAKRLELSPSFLSDVELGRRFPSKEVLRQLADGLGVALAELEKYDTRPLVEEMRHRVQAEPAYGVLLRKVIEKTSVEDLEQLLGKTSGSKKPKKR